MALIGVDAFFTVAAALLSIVPSGDSFLCRWRWIPPFAPGDDHG